MERPSRYTSLRKIGDYKHSAQTKDHDGWLLCDGRSIRKVDYPVFFDTLGIAASTATIPDGKDALLLGAGGRLKVMERGGSNEITLTIEQIPAHDHGFSDETAESEMRQGGLLNGLLQVFGGLKTKTLANRKTAQTGGGKPIKIEPVAIGANVFIFVGRFM